MGNVGNTGNYERFTTNDDGSRPGYGPGIGNGEAENETNYTGDAGSSEVPTSNQPGSSAVTTEFQGYRDGAYYSGNTYDGGIGNSYPDGRDHETN